MKEQEAKPELYTHKPPILPGIVLALSSFAKPAVLTTLAIGMYLHFTRLFIGTELLIKYIYTATFDAVFAIPMLLGVICFLPAWKHIVFRNKFEKVLVIVTGVYFLVSVPLHLQTWYSQNTDYILAFPIWFSYLFLTYSSLLMIVWLRLRVGTGD
jgi:hypothetical protein